MKIKTTWRQFWKIVLFFFTITSFYIGTGLFFIGYHNIDLSYNIKEMNCHYNMSFGDYGENFVYRTDNQLYHLGIDQLFRGIVLFFVGTFGLGVVYIIYKEG